ncbi:MAG: TonB-dependent receptor plug domain-containing protein [Candidatus Binataceae bacterium]
MRKAVRILVVLGAFIWMLAPCARADDAAAQKPPAAAKHSHKSAESKKHPAPKKEQAQKMSPIVVTATRIPQPLAEIGTTVTVVDNEDIEAQKIQHVATALREVPGVQVVQSGSPGSVTDVQIRGATPGQTLVLIDGVEVNAGATSQFDFANLTTDGLDRIEILRGAGGSLYGSSAIGGVVNVISQEGEGAPQFSLLSEGGNRATQRQVATASGAYGKLGYSAALSYFSTQGFRPVNDNSDNLSGVARLDYHLDGNTTIRGFARYIASNVSLPEYLVFSGVPLDPAAHQRNEFMLFKGEIDHRFGARLMTHASAFFVRQDLRVNAPSFTTPPPGSTYFETDSIPDETRGGNLQADYKWTEGFHTVAGFDFLDRWVRSGSYCSFCNPVTFGIGTTEFHARRQEYAGYLEQEGSFFNGHLLATAGFRVDGNSQFGEEVSPAWSVATPIKQISTTLRGSYSEGFRAPSFDELYYPNFGNPNLSPEISSEYDGGFTTDFGRIATLTTTYFSRRVHDQIVTVPCTVNTTTCVFGSTAGNASRVDVQGVEIVPQVTIAKGLKFGGSVTILDETHANKALNYAAAGLSPPRPLRVPKYSASALLQFDRGGVLSENDRVRASVNYIFVGDRDDITVSGMPPAANHAAYDLVNAVLSYQFGRRWRAVRGEEIFGRVSNLLDRHYEQAFGFPSPPVNFVAGVKLEFE